jgi:hypothetical protein
MCFQVLHNATFGIPILGTMTWTICVRQTQLPRTPAAFRSPESCRKGQLTCFPWTWQKLAYAVYSEWRDLNICKLLIFLLMRHPHSEIASTLLLFSTSCPPVTDGHQMSVQIITFVVMCYSSHITLHYNTVLKESKNCSLY